MSSPAEDLHQPNPQPQNNAHPPIFLLEKQKYLGYKSTELGLDDDSPDPDGAMGSPERELEKDLRAARGVDTLVLGASHPLTRFSDAKGFAAETLVGGNQRSSYEPVSGEAGRLLLRSRDRREIHHE